jgi:hypothetical protein
MKQWVMLIIENQVEFVLDSRRLSSAAKSALTLQHRWGYSLDCLLRRLFWGGIYVRH